MKALSVGPIVPGWTPRPFPVLPKEGLIGRYVTLVTLDLSVHGQDLFEELSEREADGGERIWTYMNYYPYPNRANFDSEMARLLKMPDTHFTAILAPSGKDKKMKAVGIAAMIRIDPPNGVLEMGYLVYSPSSLQRTAGSTELMYLLIQHAFNLGYRRVEWKCDKLNEPSNKAALRFGYTFEGIFRQAAV